MIVSMKAMKKILVIDDELGPRESLRILLKGSYNVQCAAGVDEGLRMLREDPPDLIIMDIRMPDKSGIQGLRELREIDPLVSVIMLTGFGALETAQEAMRYGASDYLKKPFDTHEIMKVIEQHIEKTDQERKRLTAADTLEEMNAELVKELADMEQMASIGQASAEFVHDLRNPLTVVIGYMQLLSDQLAECRRGLGSEYSNTMEYMDIIEKNMQRCREMANDWQEQAKNEPPGKTEVKLRDLLADLVQSVQPLASSSKAQLNCSIEAPDAVVLGSRSQIERAIHNILANAIHAVAEEEHGKIDVKLLRRDEQVQVVIVDNGCGIDRETRSRIFEPYFTTRPNGKGTGLGLPISRRIVENHGGSIQVESSSCGGTMVELSFPKAT